MTATSFSAAAPASGERVIDVGCGTGTTSLELARRVGPGGQVLGIDISKPMPALAQRRADEREAAGNLTFVEADATEHAFDRARADLIYSRFGVMFFDEPVRAFANLRSATRPGGRLSFVCFRPMIESPWYRIPIEAVRPHLPPLPPVSPDAPGMFTFARRERLDSVVSGAGYEAIEAAAVDVPHEGPTVERALSFMTNIGPVARMMEAGSPAERQRAQTALRESLEAAIRPGQPALTLGLWVVSARS